MRCAAVLLILMFLFGSPAYSMHAAEKNRECINIIGSNYRNGYWGDLDKDGYISGGIIYKLLKAAFNEVEIDVRVTFLPLIRAKTQLLDGTYPAWMYVSDTFRNGDVNKVITVTSIDFILGVIYKKKKFPALKEEETFNSLGGNILGVINGSVTPEYVDKFKRTNICVDLSNNFESMAKKLSSDRIDFILFSDISYLYISSIIKGQSEEIAFSKIINVPGAIFFSKSHPRGKYFAEQYIKGMGIIVKNGTWLKIWEEVYGKDKVPAFIIENAKKRFGENK